MLAGDTVSDPDRVEGATEGLSLLPLRTRMETDKVTTTATVVFSDLPRPWAALNGLEVAGYEIRNGRIDDDGSRLGDNLWGEGPVLVTTVHGLLEDPVALEAITGVMPRPVLEETFELLADAVETHLDTGFIAGLVE